MRYALAFLGGFALGVLCTYCKCDADDEHFCWQSLEAGIREYCTANRLEFEAFYSEWSKTHPIDADESL